MNLDCFLFTFIYVQNAAVRALTLLFLPILLFTFLKSILENVNYVVCLSLLYNKGDTQVFYDKDKDAIGAFIYFAVMEYETIVDQKVIIISNVKSQIIIPNRFLLDIINKNCVIVCVLTKNT